MYTTVYELDSWTLWKSYVFAPGIGVELLLLFAVAVACVVFGMVRRRPLVLLGAMPFLIMATFFVPVMRREFEWGRALLDLYTRGGCQVVEGRTRVEAQQRLEGHSIDRIVIGGVPLAISHFELGPQYRKSIVYGGALKEGVDARVWHCPAKAFQREGSGPIVRVDVKNR